MTDLINKIDKLVKDRTEYIQKLINDYQTVLIGTLPEKNIPYLAYIYHVSIDYINNNHKELSKDLKAWSVLVVKNLFLNGKIKKETDIINIIDDFIGYYTAEYEKYCEDIISATEFDRDNGFMFRYMELKKR